MPGISSSRPSAVPMAGCGIAVLADATQGRAFTRGLILEKVADANDRRTLATLTDDQLLVLALQGEQKVPGLYGGLSAPPQLLERAQRACDEYLQSTLQIMRANVSYQEKHAKRQEMVDSLDDRAADGDPIALLSEAPKVVELYHRLMGLPTPSTTTS